MSSLVRARRTGSQPLISSIQALCLGKETISRPGVGLGLGEGGVVAAGAADERAAGAAAAGRQQVAVASAVEEGRAGQAADQAVGAGAAVELVGAGAGLDQVVLGAALDRVVAEAAGEADAADRGQRAFDPQAVVAGAEVGHQPAAGPSAGQETWVGLLPGGCSRGRSRAPCAAVTPKVSVAGVEGDDEVVAAAAADDLQAAAAARRRVELDVGGGFRRPLPCRRRSVRPLAPSQPSLALAAVERVGAAAADAAWSSPGPPSIALACLLPIRVSRKAEPSRLSKPEEPVVAVAAGLVLRAARPRRRRPCRPPTSVAKEAMSPPPAPPSMRS